MLRSPFGKTTCFSCVRLKPVKTMKKDHGNVEFNVRTPLEQFLESTGIVVAFQDTMNALTGRKTGIRMFCLAKMPKKPLNSHCMISRSVQFFPHGARIF